MFCSFHNRLYRCVVFSVLPMSSVTHPSPLCPLIICCTSLRGRWHVLHSTNVSQHLINDANVQWSPNALFQLPLKYSDLRMRPPVILWSLVNQVCAVVQSITLVLLFHICFESVVLSCCAILTMPAPNSKSMMLFH